MKSLLKASATLAMSVVLSTNTVAVASIRSQIQKTPQKQAQTQVSLVREFAGLQSRIQYISKNLSAAGQKAADKPSEKPLNQPAEPLLTPKPETVPEVTQLFPANTPYVTFISTQGKKWQGFKRFHLYSMVEKAIAQFAPSGINFDYQRDVESWLGDKIVLGLLPKRAQVVATLESNYFALIPFRDQSRADLFLAMMTADKKRVKTREYKGVTIYEITTPQLNKPSEKTPPTEPGTKALPEETLTNILGLDSQTIVFASIPGYLISGLSSQAVEPIIDNYQDNTASKLGQNSDFQKFWQQAQQEDILMSFYQNPVEFMVLYQEIIENILKDPKLKNPQIPQTEIPQFFKDIFNPEKYKDYRYAQGFIKLQLEGVLYQAQIYNQPNPTSKQLKSEKIPLPLANRIPGATYGTFTSNNLSGQWQAIAAMFGTVKEVQDGLKSFREFVRTSTGLDFDKEIIGWLDNNYSIFTFPTKGGIFNTFFPNANIGLGFVAETKQPEIAKNTLKKLEELLTGMSGGAFKVQQQTLNGQPITSWEIDKNQSLFAYSWVEPQTIMMSTGKSAIADLVPFPRQPLTTAYNFNTATNSLPNPNNGYFYLNMGSTMSWIYGFIPQEYQNNEFARIGKEVIGSIYSLSASSSQIPNGEQFDMLMVLAPNRPQK